MNRVCFGEFSDPLLKGFNEKWSVDQVGKAQISSSEGKVSIDILKEGDASVSLVNWVNKSSLAGDFTVNLKISEMKGRGLVRVHLVGNQNLKPILTAYISGERDASKSEEDFYVSMEYYENGKLVTSDFQHIGTFSEGFVGNLIVEKKESKISVQAVTTDDESVLGGYFDGISDVAYNLQVGPVLFENVKMDVTFDDIEVACIENSTSTPAPVIKLDTVVTKEEIKEVPFTEQTVEQQLSSFINQSTIAQYLAFGITGLGVITSILSVVGIFGVKKYLKRLRELWTVDDPQ